MQVLLGRIKHACFIAFIAHTHTLIPGAEVRFHETVHGCFTDVICFHLENIKIASCVQILCSKTKCY